MNSQTAEYTKNTILTASDAKLVVLMYEGAIRFVRQASFHLKHENTAGCGQAISRAYNVLSELRLSLDMNSGDEKADELAKDLTGLYSFMMQQLVDANVNRDMKVLESVEELLDTLKSGWDGVLETA